MKGVIEDAQHRAILARSRVDNDMDALNVRSSAAI
jgi:hypothetical protein